MGSKRKMDMEGLAECAQPLAALSAQVFRGRQKTALQITADSAYFVFVNGDL